MVGIVTDRDLRSAPASATEVADVMSRKLFVIAPTASVDEAARLLRHHRVGALPVVDGETVVPTAEQSEAAGTLLGEKWAAAVQ